MPGKQLPGKAGTEKARFGQTGKPVAVDSKKAAAARAGQGRLYEDGSFVPKAAGRPGAPNFPAASGGRIAVPTKSPNPRAIERANPNASFKRAGGAGPGRAPLGPAVDQRRYPVQKSATGAGKPKALPKPPAKRR